MRSSRELVEEILAEALVKYACAELQPVMATRGVSPLLEPEVAKRAIRMTTAKFSCLNNMEAFLVKTHAEALYDTLHDVGVIIEQDIDE